jgi:transposase InsO family protein
MAHRNARLNLYGRRLLVHRVRVEHRPVAHVAKELGISRQCAHRWVNRFDAEGDTGLQDRSSRPHHTPTRTTAEIEQQVLAMRGQRRCGPIGLARHTGVPAATCGRILRRHRVPRLADCDPLTGQPIRSQRHSTNRYERDHPGDLVHVDVKKVGRIPDGGGWRAHGRSEQVRGRGIGYDYVHAAVDDHTRLAYAEILPDENGATCAAFVTRAASWFAARGIHIKRIITDNALAYRRSRAFHAAVTAIGAHQRYIKPHCPWTNGKVERFNRTLQTEWAYRRVYASNTARAHALQPWLTDYNYHRPHTALAGKPPISRLSPTS